MKANNMASNPPVNLWTSPDHTRDYLERADSISHRTEGESALLEFIPGNARRILDLGTGDGRLLALVKQHLARQPRSKPEAVALDFSPSMLEAARKRFAEDSSVTVVSHNLDETLSGLTLASDGMAALELAGAGLKNLDFRSLGLESLSFRSLGTFDAVISCFAIHHLAHERKRALYAEIHGLLNSSGVFCNLEHVASPTPRLHEQFLHGIGFTVETEDPSNKLLDVETQLQWLRDIGFADVDCHWKWRELALLAGRKP
jgi:tRNA (cmo5U34)-methyltransferase